MKGALQCYHEGVSLSSRTTAGERGRPKVRPPFIVRRPLIISRLTHDFTFLPRYVSLLTITSLRAIHAFLPAKNQCGPSVGVPKPIFSLQRVLVSSAHLRSGTALTDKGLMLGNMAFGSAPSQPAEISNFRPFIWRGFGMCNDDLTGTLTLVEAHEYYSQVLTHPRLVRHCGASALKVRIDQEPRSLRRLRCRTTRVIWEAPKTSHGCNGAVDHFGTEGTTCVVALALSEGHATRKRAGRVKGVVRRRDKRHRV
jgi:hypothetical protein